MEWNGISLLGLQIKLAINYFEASAGTPSGPASQAPGGKTVYSGNDLTQPPLRKYSHCTLCVIVVSFIQVSNQGKGMSTHLVESRHVFTVKKETLILPSDSHIHKAIVSNNHSHEVVTTVRRKKQPSFHKGKAVDNFLTEENVQYYHRPS